MTTNRRSFIRNSVAATAGMGLISSLPGAIQAATQKVAPSDQINIALIGCRSMGFGDLKNHLNIPGVNCIGLCDIDQNIPNHSIGFFAQFRQNLLSFKTCRVCFRCFGDNIVEGIIQFFFFFIFILFSFFL